MNENFVVPRLNLTQETGSSPNNTFVFNDRFRIGRHPECQVCIEDNVVSRRHAEVYWENGQWWITDLNSANGVFVDGWRIEKMALFESGRFQLGSAGPIFSYAVEKPAPSVPAEPPMDSEAADDKSEEEKTDTLDYYKSHYFGRGNGERVGEHTMMVRQAFTEVQKKQRMTYMAVIGFVLLLLIITGGVAMHKHRQVMKQRKLAAEIFYTLRRLEIDLLKMQAEAEQRRSLEAKIQIDTVRTRKEKLEQSYERYVETLNVYSKGLSEKEKIILRMAHRFGECEINMPEGFVAEVMEYIEKWQSSQRLVNVLNSAKRRGIIPRIVRTLAEQELPPQFLYLALQESNLDHRAVGPPTRFGIAKGMWQFIPSTAEKYGLRNGPLKDKAVVDRLDERHDTEKSTAAASCYLRDIYTTDAQASGLLVMASYNWGERRVIELIRSMPEDPRKRNFWQLITKYRAKIPDETYDYVFMIFSAAVIGENPKLFGFDMDNPLT